MRVCPECFDLFGPDLDDCPRHGARLVHYTQALIGSQLGPYIVRALLSEGGMGVVYVAEHPALGRRVAIKVLRPELSLRDDIVERFTQEARAVNTIGHANIVNIYDFGKTPFESFYIVMEYLDGMTIRGLLDDTGPQPVERIRFVVTEVAAALAAAHAKGFVHRDVKPANIMVCRRAHAEYVKLLDFGIAKLLTGAGQTTGAGIAMGTPQYMSPEQLEDRPLDPRADIYALGVVTYELLSGQVPFPGANQAAVRHAQATYRPPPPSLYRRDIRLAPSIDAAVQKAMAMDPDERFRSMPEFLEAFCSAHEDTLALQSDSSGGRSLARWAGVALAAALVAGLGMGGIFWARESSRTPPPAASPSPAVVPTSHRADAGPARALPTKEARALAQRLVQQALGAERRALRRTAVQHLAAVRPEAGRAYLVEALRDEDSLVRRVAATGLGQMNQHPGTVLALRKALPQQMGFAAIAMAKALVSLGDQRAVGRLKRERELARRRGPRAEQYALDALVGIDPDAAQALSRHASVVEWDDNPQAKAQLLLVLARAGDKSARDELRQATVRHDEAARVRAAVAYAQLDKAAGTRALRALTTVGPAELRATVRSALVQHGDAQSVRSLVELLGSADSEAAVVSALGLGQARVQQRLPSAVAERVRRGLSRAVQRRDGDVRLAAAVALLAYT